MTIARRAAPLLLAVLALAAACGGERDEAGSAVQAAPGSGCDEATFVRLRDEAARLHDGNAPTATVLEALLAAHACRPDAYGVNRRLGEVYTEMKLYAEALAALERALAAQPGDAVSRMGVVRLLVRIGRPEDVPARVEPLIATDTWRGEGLFRKAEALDMLGRRDEAWAVAEQGAALPAREGFRCSSLLGRFLLEEQRFEEAEAVFRDALAGLPDHPEALKGLADALHRQGRAEEAERWDAIFAVVTRLRDNVYLKADRAGDEKLALLEELVALYPENAGGFLELAEVRLMRGDAQEACAAIEALARQHPDEPALGQLRARFCTAAPR